MNRGLWLPEVNGELAETETLLVPIVGLTPLIVARFVWPIKGCVR